MTTYTQDLTKVQKFYLNNTDEIRSMFKGEFYNIEFDNDLLSKLFDQWSNIDFITTSDSQLYGISARVNFWRNTKRCVTIRYTRSNGTPTEYQKALDVYDNKVKCDPIISSFHIQIDSDDEMKIERAIIVNKRQLIEHIRDNIHRLQPYIETAKDGNTYIKLPYEYVVESKISYKIHDFA